MKKMVMYKIDRRGGGGENRILGRTPPFLIHTYEVLVQGEVF